MNYECLGCGHPWRGRGDDLPRQCPDCWGRSFISEEELKVAGIALEPLAHIWLRQALRVPDPVEVLAGPLAAATLVTVMGRTRNQVQRRQAVERILELRGFDSANAREVATRMYP